MIDMKPKEVTDAVQIVGVAFITDLAGTEVLEARLRPTRPGQPSKIVIPWSHARHAPRMDGASVCSLVGSALCSAWQKVNG